MDSKAIREQFLAFFEGHAHKRLPSASLLPSNDPTLFFTNAGMVPFKNLFLGVEKSGYSRAATSQKCMRVSGKHNDLEQVGRTARHHTFFEMLGNFSFGDYFKKEAIDFAWSFLTKKLAISEERLFITIFEDDDEAERLWTAHVPKEKIFRMGEKDNFWAMGDTGPCGPCSEIHFDTVGKGKIASDDFENGRLLEVWNLVFMQFNRNDKGELQPLAKPSIDTGMGLERLCAVMNGKPGNYETDLFMPIIQRIESISGINYGSDYSGKSKSDFSMRVIADHIRAAVFLIADGVQPSNEGRGYVLRRIMRRAIRHGRMLGIKKPFFAGLVPVVITMMKDIYPELNNHQALIQRVVKEEEERFLATVDKGLKFLETIIDDTLHFHGELSSPRLSGGQVFELYDTYGFPKDLTADIAAERGIGIDEEEFERCMESQRKRSRQMWKGSGGEKIGEVYHVLSQQGIKTQFTGYTDESAAGNVLAIIKDGVSVARATSQDGLIQFICDTTPCYGEGGGQVGDKGMATCDHAKIIITDTTKPLPDLFVHHGRLESGEIRVGERLDVTVDSNRRNDIRRNHTATHLLHSALRKVLGDHVRQAGSLVEPDRLRFDFVHYTGLSDEEIVEIEKIANEEVRKNVPVTTEEVAHQEAITKGALAFFGEKYGQKVRVVGIEGFSMELCGGTHVARTGDIGLIKIVNEQGVASGVRRLEALTGRGALAYVLELEREQKQVAELLKVSPKELSAKILRLLEQHKELEQTIRKLQQQGHNQRDLMADVRQIKGINLLTATLEADPKQLRALADQYKEKIRSGILCLATISEEKVHVVLAVTNDLAKRYHAGKLIKEVAEVLGGTGGGRGDFAQGGGSEPSHLDAAFQKLASLL